MTSGVSLGFRLKKFVLDLMGNSFTVTQIGTGEHGHVINRR